MTCIPTHKAHGNGGEGIGCPVRNNKIRVTKLSIVIPGYNEKETILPIVKAVQSVPLSWIDKEIIIVDNYFDDGTLELPKIGIDIGSCWRSLWRGSPSRRTGSASNRRSRSWWRSCTIGFTGSIYRYSGRTYEEGKKIDWKDGVTAFRCILKYNLFR